MFCDAIVYDLEIVKAIAGRKDDPEEIKKLKDEGIQYCKGWHDYEGMGVSVIGVYDYAEDRYRTFEDNWHIFFDLLRKREIHITFNGVGFDNKVLDHIAPEGF